MKSAHLLTIPFQPEDYADGTVVRMSRAELIGHVAIAAEAAGVPQPLAADLVAAMKRKSTALVAVGVFQAPRISMCKCPAHHAGFVTVQESLLPHLCGYMINLDLGGFTFHFDAMMGDIFPNVRVIEVVNG